MRISFDTREDSFEDALAVLRRAYGRHRLARKPEASAAASEADDVGTAGRVAGEKAGSAKPSAQGTTKSAAKRTPGRKTAAESSISVAAVKPAAREDTSRRAPDAGGSEGPRKRSASRGAVNGAPRGRSEAVRAWAQEQGMQVSNRGRIPAKVIAAYQAAHHD